MPTLTGRELALDEQIRREREHAATTRCRCGCTMDSHMERVAACRGCRKCFSFKEQK